VVLNGLTDGRPELRHFNFMGGFCGLFGYWFTFVVMLFAFLEGRLLLLMSLVLFYGCITLSTMETC
jgi:hypothetical protein